MQYRDSRTHLHATDTRLLDAIDAHWKMMFCCWKLRPRRRFRNLGTSLRMCFAFLASGSRRSLSRMPTRTQQVRAKLRKRRVSSL